MCSLVIGECGGSKFIFSSVAEASVVFLISTCFSGGLGGVLGGLAVLGLVEDLDFVVEGRGDVGLFESKLLLLLFSALLNLVCCRFFDESLVPVFVLSSETVTCLSDVFIGSTFLFVSFCLSFLLPRSFSSPLTLSLPLPSSSFFKESFRCSFSLS